MAKKSKKRSRQVRRRAERREAKDAALEPTLATLLLRRIRAAARTRHEVAARRLTDAEAERRRRAERAGAQGRTGKP